MPLTPRPSDSVFGLPTPLLFAHRGGAAEVAESTTSAFDHAIAARADVLEIDVQRTADGEIVVWHGPELDNVKIACVRSRCRDEKTNHIGRVAWTALRERAWVRHPEIAQERDLDRVPEIPERCLLRLVDFLERYPKSPLNIEIKADTFEPAHVADLVSALDADPGQRPILVVSSSDKLIRAFRHLDGNRRPTGLAPVEAAGFLARAAIPLVKAPSLAGKALQSPHALTSATVVGAVHRAGGVAHPFLTGFSAWLPGIDDGRGHPTAQELFPILDRGVDGVMTDRPAAVRKQIDAWIAQRA
jgi:glycerophosphoryl diester phosphodiesterase